jgi:hypothetical protein
MDLIWVSDESTSWSYPGEMEQLRSFVIHGQKAPAVEKEAGPENKSTPCVVLPAGFQEQQEQIRAQQVSLPEEARSATAPALLHLDDIKENYQEVASKTIWNKRMVPSSRLMGLAAVFAGVVLGAFVIKKMVDGFVPEPNDEIAATIISTDPAPARSNDNFKNALSTEIVAAPVVTTRQLPKTKPAALKGQMKVKTNDYKVGLFGGINGLQLTVFNTSPLFVDKIVVGVDYLKPNGAVVQSENVSFSSIRPKASQTISIPGSKRGVKVHYKILNVYSHEYKAPPRQI